MGSLGTGELLVIAVVALIVFGPKRLPELARKAGELLAKTRDATKSVTSALDSEYDGITAPLQDLKREYDTTVKGFKDAAASATNFSVDLSSPPTDKIDAPAAAPQPAETEPDTASQPAETEPDTASEPAETEPDTASEPAETEPDTAPEPAEAEAVADTVADGPAPDTDTEDTGKKPDNGA